jgi:hypothetical protein
MMKRLTKEVRDEIEDGINYSIEDIAILKENGIYDTFTTQEGLARQIDGVANKRGLIFYAKVVGKKIDIVRVPVYL